MWQDLVVTAVAAAAVGVLGRRWLRARSARPGSCASCGAGQACRTPDAESGQTHPVVMYPPRQKEEMGRERVGPGGDYRF
jgi:hypothetical protein